jgi:hypothetical protein
MGKQVSGEAYGKKKAPQAVELQFEPRGIARLISGVHLTTHHRHNLPLYRLKKAVMIAPCWDFQSPEDGKIEVLGSEGTQEYL